MMGLIDQLFSDPINTLIFILLAMPGRMLAISIHEAAHGWVAEKCGDPTARMLGRITLNPIKHFDLWGTLMMLFVGIGWAKPVPVNPRNFRNYRRDDLKVSLAGVTANFCLFIVCALVLYGIAGAAIAQLPTHSMFLSSAPSERFLMEYKGEMSFFWEEADSLYYVGLSDLLENAAYFGNELIAPAFGKIVGYLYQMVGYCMITNIMLAIFNLIPLPPLDGYHVVNDLFFKRPLFATAKVNMIASGLMYVLFFTDLLDKFLDTVSGFVFGGVGAAAGWLYAIAGIL